MVVLFFFFFFSAMSKQTFWYTYVGDGKIVHKPHPQALYVTIYKSHILLCLMTCYCYQEHWRAFLAYHSTITVVWLKSLKHNN